MRTSLLVVLLPTKERVFEEAVHRAGEAVPRSYQHSVDAEAQIAERFADRMNELEIPYIDTLPALRGALDAGYEIFPANVDGHFTVRGYQVIAEEVGREIGKRLRRGDP